MITPRIRSNPFHFDPREEYKIKRLDEFTDNNGVAKFFEEIKKRNISILWIFPTFLTLLAPHFAKINAPPLKAIISAGEQLSDNIRKATERIFNAPVFNVYATIDVGFIGQECEAHEGL